MPRRVEDDCRRKARLAEPARADLFRGWTPYPSGSWRSLAAARIAQANADCPFVKVRLIFSEDYEQESVVASGRLSLLGNLHGFVRVMREGDRVIGPVC